MQVFIAGSGKLAAELMDKLASNTNFAISAWAGEPLTKGQSIVVHAGSGRKINGISTYCRRTSSVLVELATGSSLEAVTPDFPIVLCPNTNILMLKFMCMLNRSGTLFKGNEIHIIESHQSSKISIPGTAVAIATALGVLTSELKSVRNSAEQLTKFCIPQEHLARHAFHRIEIHEGACKISMEAQVFGESPYASGVQKIIKVIQERVLQPRIYLVDEFIENGWV